MDFHNLYICVKKKFDLHREILLETNYLAVNISDIYGNSFYILWNNGNLSVEPFAYENYHVCITASQRTLERLFTERQYLFLSYFDREMKVIGTFENVMYFQKMLSYLTNDNAVVVQEEIIANMLTKQNELREDLGMIMESLHLLLANSMIDIPLETIQTSEEKVKRQIVAEKINLGNYCYECSRSGDIDKEHMIELISKIKNLENISKMIMQKINLGNYLYESSKSNDMCMETMYQFIDTISQIEKMISNE